jgi:hypothetical protein
VTQSGLGSGAKSASNAEAMERLKYYNPFGVSELKRLFPSGTLVDERTFGIPMSLIVHRALRTGAPCSRCATIAPTRRGSPTTVSAAD